MKRVCIAVLCLAVAIPLAREIVRNKAYSTFLLAVEGKQQIKLTKLEFELFLNGKTRTLTISDGSSLKFLSDSFGSQIDGSPLGLQVNTRISFELDKTIETKMCITKDYSTITFVVWRSYFDYEDYITISLPKKIPDPLRKAFDELWADFILDRAEH